MDIKTQFGIGQQVWRMHENKAVSSTVEGIEIKVIVRDNLGREPKIHVLYKLENISDTNETLLFATKEALLASL